MCFPVCREWKLFVVCANKVVVTVCTCAFPFAGNGNGFELDSTSSIAKFRAHVLSRLQGMETSTLSQPGLTNRTRAHVLSRLQGMETKSFESSKNPSHIVHMCFPVCREWKLCYISQIFSLFFKTVHMCFPVCREWKHVGL